MLIADAFARRILHHVQQVHPPSHVGRPRTLGDTEALHCMFRVCRTGMQWREVQASVSYSVVFRRMATWMQLGVFRDAYTDVLRLYKKLVPPTRYVIDSSKSRNRYGRRAHVGPDHTDRGRNAVKLSLLTDQNGVAHALSVDPGNRPDVVLLRSTLASAFVNLDKLPLFADRGYDSRKNRAIAVEYGLRDRIFRRRTRSTRRANARRIVVEHTFAWLDGYRRLHRMYEHTSEKFAAFALLALGNLVASRFLG
ncbi:hypothetical protein AB1Y20_008579 [Prymnesium parvum]|uniref:Transposase IS4-like domain-containing protein n=1 Tax=Prymnesium parvum TaxID=97485 RepID=A0AB34IUX4_PRYPA